MYLLSVHVQDRDVTRAAGCLRASPVWSEGPVCCSPGGRKGLLSLAPGHLSPVLALQLGEYGGSEGLHRKAARSRSAEKHGL